MNIKTSSKIQYHINMTIIFYEYKKSFVDMLFSKVNLLQNNLYIYMIFAHMSEENDSVSSTNSTTEGDKKYFVKNVFLKK